MNLFPLTAAHAAIQLQRGKLAICALASPAPTAALHCIAWAKAPSPSSSQGAGYLSSFDPPHAFDKDGKIVDFEVRVRSMCALQALGDEMDQRLALYMAALQSGIKN